MLTYLLTFAASWMKSNGHAHIIFIFIFFLSFFFFPKNRALDTQRTLSTIPPKIPPKKKKNSPHPHPHGSLRHHNGVHVSGWSRGAFTWNFAKKIHSHTQETRIERCTNSQWSWLTSKRTRKHPWHPSQLHSGR